MAKCKKSPSGKHSRSFQGSHICGWCLEWIMADPDIDENIREPDRVLYPAATTSQGNLGVLHVPDMRFR